MDFKLRKINSMLLLMSIALFASCHEDNNPIKGKISKQDFIIAYRSSFFEAYIFHATNGKIVKILDSLNDMSYQGDGGDLPSKYWGGLDSIAKMCIRKADRIVFNPGEKPKTFLIPELEKITRGKFLDSIATIAYKDYEAWYEKTK